MTVLNSVNDQQMTLTLQNALRYGPARTLVRDYGLKAAVAGMPGYSEGYRDAWFVGYTPKVLAGVWVGYDDSRPMRQRRCREIRRAVVGRNHAADRGALPDRQHVYRSAGLDEGGDRPGDGRSARHGRTGSGSGRHFCLSEKGAGRCGGQHGGRRGAANPGAAGMERLADDDVQRGRRNRPRARPDHGHRRQAREHHSRARRIQDARVARRHSFLGRRDLCHHWLGEKPRARLARHRGGHGGRRDRPLYAHPFRRGAADHRHQSRYQRRRTSSRNIGRSVTSRSW